MLWSLAQLVMLAALWPLTTLIDQDNHRSWRLTLAIASSSFLVQLGGSLALVTGAHSLVLMGALPPILALASYFAFRAKAPAPAAACKNPLWENLFFSLLLVGAVLLALRGLWIPPMQYDGFLYHLPSAATAWQEQTLFIKGAHPQLGSNPIFVELPKIWGFAFSGDDSLVNLQQIPYLIGLMAIAHTLATSLKASKALRIFAGIAVLFVPKVMEQVTSPSVDLIAGFWGALSVYLLSKKRLLPAGIALIVFAQLKYTTLAPACLGALFLLYLCWKRAKSLALAWALAFLVLGGFWEWRNLQTFGNPTHPYQLIVSPSFAKIASPLAPNWFVAKGEEDPGKWTGYYINRIEEAAQTGGITSPLLLYPLAWADILFVPYDRYGGRWGPAWILFAIPGLFLFFLLKRGQPIRLAFSLAVALYFVSTKSWETRFGILLLPFGFASSAWFLTLARRFFLPSWMIGFAASAVLLWCGFQISRSHPNSSGALANLPPISARTTHTGLPFATKDPEYKLILELATTLDKLATRSLWIDYAYGHRHFYGMASTLLYPYFSRDWSRQVHVGESRIGKASALAEIANTTPDTLLLQPGSLLSEAELLKLGFVKKMKNEAGEIYARN